MPGANVIVNPSFDGGLTGWTPVPGTGSIVWSSGGVTITSIGGTVTLQQSSLKPATLYRLHWVVSAKQGVGGIIGVGGGGVPNVITPLALGEDERVVMSGADALLRLRVQAAGFCRFEYILAREEHGTMSQLILTLRDFDGDKKQTSVELGPVTDGASYVTREGQAAALRDAVNAVAGNIARYQFQAQDTSPNDQNAASLVYQTHIRWIVEWVDSVTGDGPYQTDIPTAKLDDNTLVLAGSTEHNPAHADWVAFKAAFNGIVINPRTGSPVTITRIFLEE